MCYRMNDSMKSLGEYLQSNECINNIGIHGNRITDRGKKIL